ncbi:cytochrome c3 family protein [Geomonas sp. RF6]|uniref:cytochrome c3 family protein n=1 Tax=Geomonas sp. RF6 TaxID=2897342 RepID=UPI001E50C92F|nr:cytochrome c3 family protein [Geomonas sp. RF6]UFS71064.1 cytochrome c3 family protein [Geomonas sp. RF6]
MGLHIKHIPLALLLALSLAGCDPVNRHMVLSTIFDGVPTLPEPAQLCVEYNDKRVDELRDQLAGKTVAKDAAPGEESVHRPYGEKKCDDCHDKSKDSGLVRPANELCLMCHKNFFKGAYQHGPAAVGDCLACHVPHNSPDGPLLKMSRTKVCDSCHKEPRAALALHDKVAERKMACVECHNPHDGNSPFFLK